MSEPSRRQRSKVTQQKKNTAKELFRVSDLMNSFGRTLLQSDVPTWTVNQLRDLEDELFGSLLLIRGIRHSMTATPIHEKGQNA